MKKLNMTRERFEKSRYFTEKYGKLKYVSESGRFFKTNKGNILTFTESLESDEETEWFDSRGDMKKNLPMECILDCSSGGRVDDSVDFWVNELKFEVPKKKGMDFLMEYSLDDIPEWDVNKYVLWIMCGNIKDEAYEFCRGGMDYDDFETSEYPEDMNDWTEKDWDNFQSEVAICNLGM